MSKTYTLKSLIIQRIKQASPASVWTPIDFIDLGGRDAVDKALQRMVTSGDLRRIDRGLYDRPRQNLLTAKLTTPDYRHIIDAVSRRDQVRILIDGITAANDLGLSDAVPARVVVHTDGRLKPIQLGNQTIYFKLTAPSKLYWAGHPAMRIVQALYWLRDSLKVKDAQMDYYHIKTKLIRLLRSSKQASQIQCDLQSGLHTLPSWMQQWIRELLVQSLKSTKKNKS